MAEDSQDLPALVAFLTYEAMDDCLRRLKVIGQISEFAGEAINDLSDVGEAERDEIQQDSAEDSFLYTFRQLTQKEKFNKDRQCLESVLEKTYAEIKTSHTYGQLTDFVNGYERDRTNFRSFKSTILREKDSIVTMKKNIAGSKQRMKEEVEGMDICIQVSNFDLQVARDRTDMEKRYTKEFMSNKVDQVWKKLRKENESKFSQNKCLEQRITQEALADAAISDFWNETLEDLNHTLSNHKHKFYDDQRKFEREMRTLKMYRAFNLERLSTVTDKLAYCENVLETDRLEKLAEEARLAQEKIETQKAIQIQAWWRGTMVRKKLGPYAPKKKKKKKSSKKGKKGKKKGKK